MAIRLLDLTLSGIKNIKNEITIHFYNDYPSKKALENESSFKAIYGPNGSGKTAICLAMYYYKELLINPRFLATDDVKTLKKVVNSYTNVFSVSTTFYVKFDDTKTGKRYRHNIVVDFNSKLPLIRSESLYSLGARNELKKIYTYSLANGLNMSGDTSGFSDNQSVELLSSISPKYLSYLNNKGLKVSKKCLNTFAMPLVLGSSLSVYFCESKDFPIQPEFGEHKRTIKLTRIIDESISLVDSSEQIGFNELIEEKDKEKYEKRLVRMADYIRLMKPDLKEIKPRYYPLRDGLIGVDLYLVYKGDVSVALKYESTGVKKIIRMFDLFNNANKDKIIFIDEIDADIHDVFLSNLVDYFIRYSKTQMIITTHNIDLMNNIKSLKHSIDFLSQDNILTSWIKNGTASPSNAYLKGMISHIPFNLISGDFIGIFQGEDDE